MRLPRLLARVNRRVINPVQRLYAGTIPGHGIVEHVGRRTGKGYGTPVLVFRSEHGFSIIVGYGLTSDWVRNLLAAGGGGLIHRRQHYVLSRPRLLHGQEAYSVLPRGLRAVARRVKVEGVIHVDASPDVG